MSYCLTSDSKSDTMYVRRSFKVNQKILFLLCTCHFKSLQYFYSDKIWFGYKNTENVTFILIPQHHNMFLPYKRWRWMRPTKVDLQRQLCNWEFSQSTKYTVLTTDHCIISALVISFSHCEQGRRAYRPIMNVS